MMIDNDNIYTALESELRRNGFKLETKAVKG